MVQIGRIKGETAAAQGEPAIQAVRRIAELSQRQARVLFETGKVFVGTSPCLDWKRKLDAGAVVSVDTDRRRPARQPGLDPSRVLEVSRSLVVVDKPPLLVSVPPTKTGEPTVLDLLAEQLASCPGSPRPVPLHRLDRETSGLMLFGLAGADLSSLRRQFELHEVEREYYAVVAGRPDPMTLAEDIDVTRSRFGGPATSRYAVTEVEPVQQSGPVTLVRCRPRTGRFHQIRIQLAAAGHPLLGEREHRPDGYRPPIHAPRLALQSFRLTFHHPDLGRNATYELPVDPYLQELVRKGAEAWDS
ncbi:MAG: RNA pseudouridine synthase [Deltaproteobacteria bacterium]|nr:RNA pseudouridine synthase [Deltaproteobacteria bacterium]